MECWLGVACSLTWEMIFSNFKRIDYYKRISKFAFISHVLPPSAFGQAVAIFRLLSCANPNHQYLFSRQPAVDAEQKAPDPFRLKTDEYLGNREFINASEFPTASAPPF